MNIMVILASIFGLLAALAGLMIGLGIEIAPLHWPIRLPEIADLFTPTALARICGPVATLLGVIVLVPERRIGATLMLIGAAGMALTLALPAAAAPVTLGGFATALALYSDMRRRQART